MLNKLVDVAQRGQSTNKFTDWKSVIFGVWAAPGARKTLQKGGLPFFWRVSRATWAAQTPQITDFRSLKKVQISSQTL